MASDHNAKLYTYDQLKISTKLKQVEMRAIRNSLHRTLRADTFDEQKARQLLCADHFNYNASRDAKRLQLQQELRGWDRTIEDELRDAGYPPIDPVELAVPEEEYCMSYMLTQIEMELSLKTDYDSITEATKTMAMEIQQGIREFDETEKKVKLLHSRRCT